MNWKFERIGQSFGDMLDGPIWDGDGLLFCKVAQSEILRYDAATGNVRVFRPFSIRNSGLTIAPNGNLYGTQSGARRVAWYKRDGTTTLLSVHIAGLRHNHPHDLVADSKGRVWFSDVYSLIRTRGPQIFPPLDHCSVLRLDYDSQKREWNIKRMTFDTVEPRGLALSPDEQMLYVADTSTAPQGPREIKAYPIDSDGTLSVPIVLHTFGADYRGIHRGAWGMCTDIEGNLIVAAGSKQSGPGPMIYVFAPTGQVLETHVVPANAPTNCTFGGADMDTLFVTTDDGGLFQVGNTGRKGMKQPARAA